MATEQLEGEVLQPHIKAPVNPRPQLPQMPQRSAHTQLSPSQTRIEQTMVLPQTQLIPLTSVHHQDLLSQHRWNAATLQCLFYSFFSLFDRYRRNVTHEKCIVSA